MRAMAIRHFGGPSVVHPIDLPVPEPDEGEILVRVRAAGVNPVDWKIREGYLKDAFPHEFPVVLGWDAAGIVERAGPGTSRFKKGDEVYAYCRTSIVHSGAYAEFVSIPEVNAAVKPRNLSFEEAAAVPLAGLTAYQCLFDAAKLKSREAVLIHAAAGGVGAFAVQLAKSTGAYVLGTAREENHPLLKSLGCDCPIDYTKTDFRTAARKARKDGLDAVLDTIGGDVYERSISLLKKGGRMVSLIERRATEQGKIKEYYVFCAPNAVQLMELTDMFEQGKLKPVPIQVLDLNQARQAQERSASGRTAGKIVLRVQ